MVPCMDRNFTDKSRQHVSSRLFRIQWFWPKADYRPFLSVLGGRFNGTPFIFDKERWIANITLSAVGMNFNFLSAFKKPTVNS